MVAASGLLQVDDLGDEYGAPDMGNQQPHALARRVVDQAMPLVAKHAEHGGAGRRLLEGGADEVDKALRLRPFAVEARLEEFGIGQQIRRRHRSSTSARKARSSPD